MTTPPPSAPAGWYPDPDGGELRRYWDGSDWGPTEPSSPSTGNATPPEPISPQPESASDAWRLVKQEMKQEWNKAQAEAEEQKAALNVKITLWAAGIVWLLFTIGTWASDTSILGKIGFTFLWFFGAIFAAVKSIGDDEKKAKENK